MDEFKFTRKGLFGFIVCVFFTALIVIFYNYILYDYDYLEVRVTPTVKYGFDKPVVTVTRLTEYENIYRGFRERDPINKQRMDSIKEAVNKRIASYGKVPSDKEQVQIAKDKCLLRQKAYLLRIGHTPSVKLDSIISQIKVLGLHSKEFDDYCDSKQIRKLELVL